jgi:hypothetical protein
MKAPWQLNGGLADLRDKKELQTVQQFCGGNQVNVASFGFEKSDNHASTEPARFGMRCLAKGYMQFQLPNLETFHLGF